LIGEKREGKGLSNSTMRRHKWHGGKKKACFELVTVGGGSGSPLGLEGEEKKEKGRKGKEWPVDLFSVRGEKNY